MKIKQMERGTKIEETEETIEVKTIFYSNNHQILSNKIRKALFAVAEL